MKLTMIMSFLGAAAAATGVSGASVQQPRDTWNPKILTPNASSVWTYGGVRGISSQMMLAEH
jgi:hypothetical protein